MQLAVAIFVVEGGLDQGCLSVVEWRKRTLIRSVFAEVAQLIEH